METDTITNAIDFLTKIKQNDEVRIKFRKKDKSIRVMRCTLNFDRIPEHQKPKDVNFAKMLKSVTSDNQIHVFDLDRQEWRTVNFNTAEWLEVPEQKLYKIKRY